jgi:hypothetical protein
VELVPTGRYLGTALVRGAAPWAMARQLLSMQGEIPSSVAIWIRGRPLLSRSATASRLNPASSSSSNTFPLPIGAYQRCPSKRGMITIPAVAWDVEVSIMKRQSTLGFTVMAFQWFCNTTNSRRQNIDVLAALTAALNLEHDLASVQISVPCHATMCTGLL